MMWTVKTPREDDRMPPVIEHGEKGRIVQVGSCRRDDFDLEGKPMVAVHCPGWRIETTWNEATGRMGYVDTGPSGYFAGDPRWIDSITLAGYTFAELEAIAATENADDAR